MGYDSDICVRASSGTGPMLPAAHHYLRQEGDQDGPGQPQHAPLALDAARQALRDNTSQIAPESNSYLPSWSCQVVA